MDQAFWLDRWQTGRTGFHREGVHPDLVEQREWLLGDRPQRILVPLCGRSHDLAWLAEAGHDVVGVEFASDAVQGIFSDWGHPAVSEVRGAHTVFTTPGDLPIAGRLQVWCGDFFALPDDVRVDCVWDRAALVALPPDRRRDYVARILAMVQRGRMLLNVIDYDPSVMSGPPFPVTTDDVVELYSDRTVTLLEQRDIVDVEPRWRAKGHDWFKVGLYTLTREERALGGTTRSGG